VAVARSAGASLSELALPDGLVEAIAIHRTIVAAEAHRFLGPLVVNDRNQCTPVLLALLDEGATVTQVDYSHALAARETLSHQFGEWAANFDAILTLPALGEAPSIATTGDPQCCTRWTLVGAPAITVPTGRGPSGLPLGIQLVGHLGRDDRLIGVAEWFESLRPSLGRPSAPQRTR
jgi:Asp-tRNA(Asn)/Glu-tRNA(Gln) amidotransferase A subunit family amidase